MNSLADIIFGMPGDRQAHIVARTKELIEEHLKSEHFTLNDSLAELIQKEQKELKQKEAMKDAILQDIQRKL